MGCPPSAEILQARQLMLRRHPVEPGRAAVQEAHCAGTDQALQRVCRNRALPLSHLVTRCTGQRRTARRDQRPAEQQHAEIAARRGRGHQERGSQDPGNIPRGNHQDDLSECRQAVQWLALGFHRPSGSGSQSHDSGEPHRALDGSSRPRQMLLQPQQIQTSPSRQRHDQERQRLQHRAAARALGPVPVVADSKIHRTRTTSAWRR